MLNGVDPIFIFNIFKNQVIEGPAQKFSLISDIKKLIQLPPIPLYLSEQLTGLYIDAESKGVEVDSETDTNLAGTEETTNQKGIESTVKIDMTAVRGSPGIILLSALIDVVYPKVTAKEYSIDYLNGAVTVFGGKLKSFNLSQNANDDKYAISIELIKPSSTKKPVPKQDVTPRLTSAQRL